ncbi:MAG: DUF808 domain-containing protein [Ketobacteraceae bacterium]|nr:DUF808 domain-containing protein [Ketobacteraceae bacterium]
MAAGSLLALLDDIATLLDDISVMSKMAAKKTAGVLGDDLAVNAEQVSGVRASRELPVVWAVAKGSMLNKVIIVPAILLLSVMLPALITPILILGGCYLCFEGAEKVWHSFTHRNNKDHAAAKALVDNPKANLVAIEKKKIKGAIKTDFILSLEIIVIALSTMSEYPFAKQATALAFVAIVMTIGVYGLVALIVKIDDMGIYLVEKEGGLERLGRFLLWFAPAIMKSLTVIGTVAMFLVGGGILTHSLEHYLGESASLVHFIQIDIEILQGVVHTLYNGLAGILAGALIVFLVSLLPLKNHQE